MVFISETNEVVFSAGLPTAIYTLMWKRLDGQRKHSAYNYWSVGKSNFTFTETLQLCSVFNIFIFTLLYCTCSRLSFTLQFLILCIHASNLVIKSVVSNFLITKPNLKNTVKGLTPFAKHWKVHLLFSFIPNNFMFILCEFGIWWLWKVHVYWRQTSDL